MLLQSTNRWLLVAALFPAALFQVVLPAELQSRDTPQQSNGAVDSNAYPNTADGLHRLLSDLLLTAKIDDQIKLWLQVREMEIPNYEDWFTRTFGQEKGKSLAGVYGKSLESAVPRFRMLWTELAKQEGEISIQKVDVAQRYGTLSGPLDEYKAGWKKTDNSVGPDSQLIGAFYYGDGKFRLDPSSMNEVRLLSPNKAGPVKLGKLIKRVKPVYPDTARKSKIQGTVSVNVIVRKDGTVSAQNVGAGDPLLAPAAIAAVQKWRFEPTTVSGEPVDVEMKLYVVFALHNYSPAESLGYPWPKPPSRPEPPSGPGYPWP